MSRQHEPRDVPVATAEWQPIERRASVSMLIRSPWSSHSAVASNNWRQVPTMEDDGQRQRWRTLLGRNGTFVRIAAVISAIVCRQSTGKWLAES
jgi:hypothetical protein